jgi:RNA polymerase sigma-70 factor (ECF subfamily)
MARDPKPKLGRHEWAAFETEVLPHFERLFRFAMWFEGRRDEAEDLVQATLLEALKSFHRFVPGTNCSAWLISILRHVRSKRQRSRNQALVVDDPEDRIVGAIPFVPPVPQNLTDEDVLAALKQIPPEHQEVILLCDVEELTYKEIAAVLGIPMGTVMSRLHRGRELLRGELAKCSHGLRKRPA